LAGQCTDTEYKTSTPTNEFLVEETENLLSIFPNPIYDEMYFEYLLSEPINLTVSILDLFGNTLLQSSKAYLQKKLMTSVRLNAQSLSPGIYILRLTGKKTFLMKQFIKL